MIIEGKTLFANGFEEAICGTSDDGRVIYSDFKQLNEHINA